MNDARSTIRTIRKTAAMAVLTLAGLTMLAANMLGNWTLFRFGMTGWLIAATTYVIPRTGVTVRVLERERQRGYDDGYSAGRLIPRPVVVPFRSAGLKPALNLGKKNVVGGLSQDGP